MRGAPIRFNELVRALRAAGFEVPGRLQALEIRASIDAGVTFEATGYLGAPCDHDFVQSTAAPWVVACSRCGAAPSVTEMLEEALQRAGLSLVYRPELGALEFVGTRKWGHMIFRNEVEAIDSDDGWAQPKSRGLSTVDFQLPGGSWMQITATGAGRLQVSAIEKPEDAP